MTYAQCLSCGEPVNLADKTAVTGLDGCFHKALHRECWDRLLRIADALEAKAVAEVEMLESWLR